MPDPNALGFHGSPLCFWLFLQGLDLEVLFAAGDLFVEPVRWLAAQLTLSWLSGTALLTDLEFVGAILAYGLLSWLLVRLLRVLLNH